MTKSKPFHSKHTQQTRNKGDFFNLLKDIYEKPTADNILDGERWKALSRRSGSRPECLFLPFLFITVQEVPARVIRRLAK